MTCGECVLLHHCDRGFFCLLQRGVEPIKDSTEILDRPCDADYERIQTLRAQLGEEETE